MTVSLVFLTALMVTFAGWLLWSSFNVRPWEAQSATDDPAQPLPSMMSAGRVGLIVFLAVVTSLFALTISAYMMRMEVSGDWQPLPIPGLLWFNTLALMLASVALQWARHGTTRADGSMVARGLWAGGIGSMVFIVGQLVVWYQLSVNGHHVDSNPADAFFYLLTALHGVHLLGGLVVWGRLLARVRRGAAPVSVHSHLELCTLYWHYLAVVWIVLFALLLLDA
ncbi:cytochrome c oxidase subunit 3 [Aidingimonas lacisalsi]|uniref:cytochrome c oxidase subunit 3 n=1 Tax=Aidingimonas lacisalsi TaxID=2604086 RepID=UPI0011D1F1B6|nr:cytochrome c oxidase subunit 3 [Aidingimonas lacisalsi]